MDIFKLIYEHDIRLDKLKERPANHSENGPELSLEDFMKPDPTFSKFYITGTLLSGQPNFGLNTLRYFPEIMDQLEESLKDFNYFVGDRSFNSLAACMSEVSIGTPVVMTRQKHLNERNVSLAELRIDDLSNIGQRKSSLRKALMNDLMILYKETAHHGFDLHLFSRENIYSSLFFPLKTLCKRNDFRFFSINGKRINSERKFYFETWTLHRPPHGAEEVFTETVLS